ncbi:MAG TPA: transglutaminase-like domain-containing protein [Chthoniobacteraceae bacterium]|nr:transglutaminase-like domain-containing protein [Chthoniobacteraceae bacterium]
MTNQSAALLQLLGDDDPETFSLIKTQLAGAGLARLDELRRLRAQASGAAARHLREVICEIESREADALFAQLCAGFGEHGDLEEAAWRLAATFGLEENFERQRGFLDSWALEVRRRVQKAHSEVDRIETLVEFLGHEVGLRGNEEDYYNINNSLLPEVIDTRRGIPITLSLVYLLVAARAGLSFAGVGLPGHFVIRSGEHFFDPFRGGKRIGIGDCHAIAKRFGYVLEPAHFEPVAPRQMLTRMLGNIVALSREADPPLAAKVSGWIEALRSGNTQTLEDGSRRRRAE